MDDGSSMTMSMTSIPAWVRLLATAVMVVVLLLHVVHLRREVGLWRWWHGCHVAMAVGMAAMYAAPDATMGSGAPVGPAGLVLYLGLAAAAGVTVLGVARRSGRLDVRWIAATAGLLAMALMFTPMSVQAGALGSVAVIYLLGEAVVWLTARWWQPTTELVAEVLVADRALAGTGAAAEGATRLTEVRRVRVTTVHTPLDVRLSLAVMALLMAGMLAAM